MPVCDCQWALEMTPQRAISSNAFDLIVSLRLLVRVPTHRVTSTWITPITWWWLKSFRIFHSAGTFFYTLQSFCVLKTALYSIRDIYLLTNHYFLFSITYVTFSIFHLYCSNHWISIQTHLFFWFHVNKRGYCIYTPNYEHLSIVTICALGMWGLSKGVPIR